MKKKVVTIYLVLIVVGLILGCLVTNVAAKSTESCNPNTKINITNLNDSDIVSQKQLIKGTSDNVSEQELNIYVLTYPYEAGMYWVQDKADIKPNGEWTVIGTYGEPEHTGKLFKTVAIVTKNNIK